MTLEVAMGTRGPIPKRSDLRMGHPHEAQNPADVTRVQLSGVVEPPELGFEPDHEIVTEIWEAVKLSGQAIFYEPSDWVMFKFWLQRVDETLEMQGKRGYATMLDVVASQLSQFNLTEGDRRRVKMEIDRSGQSEALEAAHQEAFNNVIQLATGTQQ
jgi:hypothetical protein